MTMQADLRDRLAGLAGGRVYWMTRPQSSALPAITLQTVSEGREQLLRGFDSIQQSRVQIDCWGKNYAEAQTLSDDVIGTVVPAATQGGTVFSRSMITTVRDLHERTETQEIFRKSVDLVVSHSPAT